MLGIVELKELLWNCGADSVAYVFEYGLSDERVGGHHYDFASGYRNCEGTD